MKLPEIIKTLKIPEIILLIVFIIFIVFPVSIPPILSPWIDQPLGVALLLILTIYLLVYIHPLVGVLFIWVAYELVHRASKVSHTKIPISEFYLHPDPATLQSQQQPVETESAAKSLSLEEETVVQYGVYETNPTLTYYETSFHPVYDFTHNATPI
jgi:hypothetical protein